jgi:hypothetical protein
MGPSHQNSCFTVRLVNGIATGIRGLFAGYIGVYEPFMLSQNNYKYRVTPNLSNNYKIYNFSAVDIHTSQIKFASDRHIQMSDIWHTYSSNHSSERTKTI